MEVAALVRLHQCVSVHTHPHHRLTLAILYSVVYLDCRVLSKNQSGLFTCRSRHLVTTPRDFLLPPEAFKELIFIRPNRLESFNPLK